MHCLEIYWVQFELFLSIVGLCQDNFFKSFKLDREDVWAIRSIQLIMVCLEIYRLLNFNNHLGYLCEHSLSYTITKHSGAKERFGFTMPCHESSRLHFKRVNLYPNSNITLEQETNQSSGH